MEILIASEIAKYDKCKREEELQRFVDEAAAHRAEAKRQRDEDLTLRPVFRIVFEWFTAFFSKPQTTHTDST